jgi:hypothetical protein
MVVAFSFALPAFTACEKKLDYNVPPAEHTLEKDIHASFDILSANNRKWIWPLTITSNPFFNEGIGFLAEFKKDSTANVQLIAKKGIVEQFAVLLASGKLDANQTAIARAYTTTFGGFTDWNLRNLIINNPANASFLNNTLRVLPNMIYFNPIFFAIGESGFNYNVNGPVQLSLTFTNTSLFPQLKQGRVLDYDFRIFSFSSGKVDLMGYYNNSANKASSLYATVPDDIALFANGSNIFVPEGYLQAGSCSIKANGVNVPVPAGFTGLSLFYQFYGQLFLSEAGTYGFALANNNALVPAALKASAYYTVKSAYAGNLATAPSGTVLVALTGRNGTETQTVEFIKD